MEPNCMTHLRQKLRYWDDVLTNLPDEWLRKATASLALTSLIYGFFTMAFGVWQHDMVIVTCGALGLIVTLLTVCPCFSVVYTLWFNSAALLLLIGGALMNVQEGVSYFLYGLGGIFMALLAIGSLLLRCNICATGHSAPNVVVAYHVPRAEDV